MTADERAIRELVATWMAASRAGDLDTVLGLMTEDVVFMVPGRAPFGKEAFAAQSRGMGEARLEGTSDIRELRILGDWAFMRNHIEISLTPPAENRGAAPATRSRSCARKRTAAGASRGMRIC